MSEIRQIPLGAVVNFKKGINYTSNDYGNEDNGVPFITIKCFKKGGGYENNGLKYFKGIFNESDTLVKGQVLFSVTDLTRAGDIVGSPLKVPDFGKNRISLASMDLMKIEPKDGECINEYIYYCLMSDDIRRKMVNYSAGSTVLHLDIKRVPEFIVPIPKISIQRKIARILSTIDVVIEKTEAAIDKYKNIKAGMMHDLFTRGIDLATGKLRSSYEEAPELYKQSALGWVSKEWEVTNIGKSNVQIIDGDRGSNYPHEDELLEHGYCLFLNASNVTMNGFVFLTKMFISQEKENLLGSGKLERNDIIITTRGTVGNIAFYYDDIHFDHMRINSGMLILRNYEQKMISEFLYQSFKNYLFDIDFRRVVSGSAQPQLPMKDLKNFHLIKPNEIEQQKIIDICTHYDNLLNSEIESLRKMQQLKQGLMSDLLTGKVRVKYEEEKEEAL